MGGTHLVGRIHGGVEVGAPPLFGRYGFDLDAGLAIPMGFAVAAVAYGPRLAEQLGWRRLLLAAALASAAWICALQISDGPRALIGSLRGVHDYLAGLPLAQQHSVSGFLSSFTTEIDRYPIHVEGHPPGMVLLLWGLNALGLSGPWWAAPLIIAVGASAVPAVLLAVRDVADETTARRVAPFLVLVPAAVWMGTTADALYAGVGAWATAAGVLATSRSGRRSDVLAAAAGLTFGIGIFLSYGLVALGSVYLVVALSRRRFRPLFVTGAGVLAVVAVFAALGFWWLEGLGATRIRYYAGIGGRRPYWYFLFANPAAFAVALGPAVAAALASLRDRRLWLLVGGALLAVFAANVSGLSKAEVERIWLPFVPWVLVSTASLRPRAWLGLQGAAALGVQIFLR